MIHRLQGGVAPSGFVLPYPRSLAAVVARTEAALVTLPEPLAERRRALAVMALEGNPAVMAALEQALPRPRWPLWQGCARKLRRPGSEFARSGTNGRPKRPGKL